MGVEEGCAIPEEGVEGPREREACHGEVDGQPVWDVFDGNGLVGKVKSEEIEEVDKDEDLCDDKVLLGEEVAPEKVQDVEEREVGTDNGNEVGLVGRRDVAVEEGFGDEEKLRQEGDPPVDGGDDDGGAEGGDKVFGGLCRKHVEERCKHREGKGGRDGDLASSET